MVHSRGGDKGEKATHTEAKIPKVKGLVPGIGSGPPRPSPWLCPCLNASLTYNQNHHLIKSAVGGFQVPSVGYPVQLGHHDG